MKCSDIVETIVVSDFRPEHSSLSFVPDRNLFFSHLLFSLILQPSHNPTPVFETYF